MGESKAKRCVHCGIDMVEDAAPSKFDSNYCEFCQNQETGAFETSQYRKVFEFVAGTFFQGMHTMNKKDAEANAEILIKFNPSILLRIPCTT